MIDSELRGFADLCINKKVFVKNIPNLLNNFLDDNVRTIAINEELDLTGSEQPAPTKNVKGKRLLPNPTLDIPKEFKNEFVILNRLTVKFSTLQEGQILSKKEIRKLGYHIIAAMPLTEVAFKFCIACDIDILTLDTNTKISWTHVLTKHYKTLVTKCIYFEMQYCPLLSDPISRSNVIQVAFELLNNYKGVKNNIIVSSGMNLTKNYRSPYNVISLCAILGLNEIKAKDAILKNPKDLIRLAVNRMHGKSVLKVVVHPEPMPKFKGISSRKSVIWEKNVKLS